ncbi:hypothetical protein [Pantoea sp. AS-PWVM4]|uniref:hypothetical protein n=1 Tax=Pantoea sp. AS-PWVM4 TaxID=1332069 RepID=UPI001F2097B9|nr:hypothetical protein [Pantoea sp. AS-PWVM4]
MSSSPQIPWMVAADKKSARFSAIKSEMLRAIFAIMFFRKPLHERAALFITNVLAIKPALFS